MKFGLEFIPIYLYDMWRIPQDCLYSLWGVLVWLGGQNVIFEKVGAKMWFVEFWGQDVILGEFGIEMWFWRSLGSKCNFKRIWGWNVILGILGSKCNFGSLWVFLQFMWGVDWLGFDFGLGLSVSMNVRLYLFWDWALDWVVRKVGLKVIDSGWAC